MKEPRMVRAANAGSFTLDGTRTFIVGHSHVAVIDPGPDDPEHLGRVATEVRASETGSIVLTHGHPDHADGARALSRLTGFPIVAPLMGADRVIRDGDRIRVDDEDLRAVATPGHAPEHLAFLHRPGEGASVDGVADASPQDRAGTGGDLYVGDLVLGEGNTTWVGGYSGCLRDYLASLDRVDRLAPTRLLPAHGPVLDRPAEVIGRFRAHRIARIEQVRRSLEARALDLAAAGAPLPDAAIDEILFDVYGRELTSRLAEGARWSVRATLEYLGVAPFPEEGAPAEGSDRLAPGSGPVVSSE